jgi:hypothetical protein
MDDLISRQAVINVIDKIFPVEPMLNDYTQGITCGAALAKTYIEQLPSAQPEVVRCKDCKFYTQMRPDLKIGICSLACRHLGDDGFCSEAGKEK